MMAVPHIGFILAAYLVTAAVVGGAAVAVLLDRRALTRALRRLEAHAGRGRGEGPR